MTRARIIITLLTVFLGAGTAAFFYHAGSAPAPATETKPSGGKLSAVTDDAFGGSFTLVDQDGKTVTEKDFTGRYRLIYFGFTYCPAICPTELQKITAVLNSLGDAGKDVLPMFITVDPERDTPEKIKAYIKMFHPSFVGLTGSEEQVKKTLKNYKIYAAKVTDPNMSDYTVDHSTSIYFMGPDDRLLHIFKMRDTAEEISHVVSNWLQENARQD